MDSNVALAQAVEQIDIGGVALLRAAAKNHESVTVVCEPTDYDAVAEAVAAGGTDEALRQRLALKAFRHTANYDGAIADYLAAQATQREQAADEANELPARIQLDLRLAQRNRYGENPHQRGGFYTHDSDELPFEQLHGKEMSYNNWLDLDGSWRAAQDFAAPTVAIIKHGNPCGLASAVELAMAYDKALVSDPVSAFGSVISVNRTLDVATAQKLREVFVEIVAAPDYEAGALEILQRKQNIRILRANKISEQPLTLRSVYGGVLVQDVDASQDDMDAAQWRVVSKVQPSDVQLADLAFAWRTARWVKSNAIVFARDEATVGVGAGQMSRVDAVMLAAHKAGARAQAAPSWRRTPSSPLPTASSRRRITASSPSSSRAAPCVTKR